MASSPQHLVHSLNHIRHIAVAQFRRQRQAHGLLANAKALWIIFRSPTKSFPIERMNRNTLIMNPNANILGSHGRDELISSNSSLIRFNQYSVEVVGVTRSFFRRRRKKQRKSAQLALVGSPYFLPSLPLGFNAA